MSGALALSRVMDEMAQVLSSVIGSAVTGWPPATIAGSAAGYITYPRQITFDETYGRGEDIYEDVPVVVLVADPTDRRTRDRIAPWCDSTGPDSVKQAFESHVWTSCDDVRIGTGEFDVETVGGVDYLTVIFKAAVTGPGKDS